MAPIGWGWAPFVWGYALAWFLVNDRVKLAGYRILETGQASLARAAHRKMRLSRKTGRIKQGGSPIGKSGSPLVVKLKRAAPAAQFLMYAGTYTARLERNLPLSVRRGLRRVEGGRPGGGTGQSHVPRHPPARALSLRRGRGRGGPSMPSPSPPRTGELTFLPAILARRRALPRERGPRRPVRARRELLPGARPSSRSRRRPFGEATDCGPAPRVRAAIPAAGKPACPLDHALAGQSVRACGGPRPGPHHRLPAGSLGGPLAAERSALGGGQTGRGAAPSCLPPDAAVRLRHQRTRQYDDCVRLGCVARRAARGADRFDASRRFPRRERLRGRSRRPSGRFLYGSNRGHDSIAIFGIDETRGTLSDRPSATLGKCPRNFAIDPTGVWLLAANQDSDSIVVFRIDPATGRLSPAGQAAAVSMPVCVKFMASE